MCRGSIGKIKPLFTRAHPPAALRFAPVSPLDVPLSRPSPQRRVSAGGGRAGCPPCATRSARRAAGAGLVHWSYKRLGRLSWGVPLYGVGVRLFGADVGFIASLLLAVNALFIQYAQETRAYALVLLFATSSSYLFLRALDNPSRKNWAGYTVVGALSLYAHLFGVWVIASHFVSAMVSRSGFVGRKRRIISYACIALLGSPLLAAILATTGDQLFWLKPPSWGTLAGFFWAFTGYGEPVLVILYLGVCCFALLSASAQQYRAGGPYIPWNFVFLCTWLFLPVLGTFLFSLLVKPLFHPRYLIISLPPLVLMAAAGVQRLRPTRLRLMTLLLLLALSGQSLWKLYTGAGRFQKENWRAAAEYVLDNTAGGDGVVFLAPYVRRPFEYYVQAWHAQAKAPRPVIPISPLGRT
jgi:4-amino-4-deoxy-L-arabinose transferase-like glycosyltransferase